MDFTTAIGGAIYYKVLPYTLSLIGLSKGQQKRQNGIPELPVSLAFGGAFNISKNLKCVKWLTHFYLCDNVVKPGTLPGYKPNVSNLTRLKGQSKRWTQLNKGIGQMEFQIGQIYVRIVTDVKMGLVQFKAIFPVNDTEMQVIRVMVSRNGKHSQMDIEEQIYLKGDKDEEKSAFS